jgi:hypothetical protein
MLTPDITPWGPGRTNVSPRLQEYEEHPAPTDLIITLEDYAKACDKAYAKRGKHDQPLSEHPSGRDWFPNLRSNHVFSNDPWHIGC